MLAFQWIRGKAALLLENSPVGHDLPSHTPTVLIKAAQLGAQDALLSKQNSSCSIPTHLLEQRSMPLWAV